MARSLSLSDLSVIKKSPNASKTGLEDINTLLALETAKRFKEHEENLRSQAEEKSRQYHEAQAEYRHYYNLYVRLHENAATRSLLESHCQVSQNQLDQLSLNIQHIDEKVVNEEITRYFAADVIENSQKAIRQLKKYDDIGLIQKETVSMKNAVETIQSLNTSIEQKLESVVTRSIDFHAEQLQKQQHDESFQDFD